MTISFLDILLRLGVALILGAIIGFERESTEHTAGLRTQALVSLGSALFTVISAFGFLGFTTIPHVQIDPTRIASYIVAGIGFLGAGSIFLDQHRVRGLTTAATVWLVAAIGMACGAGFLWQAVIVTILALIVLIALRYVERLLLLRNVQRFIAPGKFSESQHLHIEATPITGQLTGQVYDSCTRAGISVEKLSVHADQEADIIIVACRVPNATMLAQIIGELHALPGVRDVQADMQGTPIGNSTLKGNAGKAS